MQLQMQMLSDLILVTYVHRNLVTHAQVTNASAQMHNAPNKRNHVQLQMIMCICSYTCAFAQGYTDAQLVMQVTHVQSTDAHCVSDQPNH